MKGKYDGRKNNGRYKSTIKRGPKPLYLQHISGNRAALIVKEFDSIESWPQILTAAWEKLDIAACTQVRMYVHLAEGFGRGFGTCGEVPGGLAPSTSSKQPRSPVGVKNFYSAYRFFAILGDVYNALTEYNVHAAGEGSGIAGVIAVLRRNPDLTDGIHSVQSKRRGT